MTSKGYKYGLFDLESIFCSIIFTIWVALLTWTVCSSSSSYQPPIELFVILGNMEMLGVIDWRTLALIVYMFMQSATSLEDHINNNIRDSRISSCTYEMNINQSNNTNVRESIMHIYGHWIHQLGLDNMVAKRSQFSTPPTQISCIWHRVLEYKNGGHLVWDFSTSLQWRTHWQVRGPIVLSTHHACMSNVLLLTWKTFSLPQTTPNLHHTCNASIKTSGFGSPNLSKTLHNIIYIGMCHIFHPWVVIRYVLLCIRNMIII